jgi:ATP-dependent Lon protease
MSENDDLPFFTLDFLEEASEDEIPCVLTIEIYDPAEIQRKLSEDALDDSVWGEETVRSNEGELWRRRLKALIKTPGAAQRSLLIADDAMIKRIDALKNMAPHFGEITDLFLRAAKLSQSAQSPLLLPPLLLLGNPGIGKTFYARNLAMALNTYLETVAIDILSDSFELTGLAMSWKAARPGKIASALIASKTASPIYFLDEVDKANAIHYHDKPLNFLHSALEPENARKFVDDYYMMGMRLDQAIWVLTANTLDGLAPSIIDRLMIAYIDEPTRDQLHTIVQGTYTRTKERFNRVFAGTLNEAAVNHLLEMNPRKVRKILEIALGFAQAEKANELSVEYIKKANCV